MKKIQFILLALVSFLWSCSQNQEQQYQNEQTEEVVELIEQKESSRVFILKDDSENEVANLKITGEAIEIKTDKGILKASGKSGGKRKYKDASGKTVFEIKYKTSGFKLRSPAGDLIWKVKIKAEKIKISDNEENQDPYELKMKDDGRVKVKRNDAEVGKSAFMQSEGKVKITSKKRVLRIETKENAWAFGALAIDRIPTQEAYIIFLELLQAK